ncbi:MAG: PEP-CTERM sorting domain-containing protein [Pseudomonadales bacterium]|nr:PEP-CTERM sorting domain-containing protein [Pseudomonadales bacterium]
MKSRSTLAPKALALAIAAISGSAQALLVDGILSAGEYGAGETIFFNPDTQGSNPEQGFLSYAIQGDAIYVALAAPISFVDNVYGTLSNGSYKGKKGSHKFTDLLGSDRLIFGLDTDSGTPTNVVIDYLADYSDPNDPLKVDVKGSNKGSFPGIQDASFTQHDETDDAEYETGPNDFRAVFGENGATGVLLDVATSLEYNLANYDGANLNDSPDNSIPDGDGTFWEDQLIYEFKLDATQFTDFSVASILSPLIHASPSKLGTSVFEPNCDLVTSQCGSTSIPSTVPEPSGMLLILSGLLGMGWMRRKGQLK